MKKELTIGLVTAMLAQPTPIGISQQESVFAVTQEKTSIEYNNLCVRQPTTIYVNAQETSAKELLEQILKQNPCVYQLPQKEILQKETYTI